MERGSVGSGSDLGSQSFFYEKGDLFSEEKFGEHKTFLFNCVAGLSS